MQASSKPKTANRSHRNCPPRRTLPVPPTDDCAVLAASAVPKADLYRLMLHIFRRKPNECSRYKKAGGETEVMETANNYHMLPTRRMKIWACDRRDGLRSAALRVPSVEFPDLAALPAHCSPLAHPSTEMSKILVNGTSSVLSSHGLMILCVQSVLVVRTRTAERSFITMLRGGLTKILRCSYIRVMML